LKNVQKFLKTKETKIMGEAKRRKQLDPNYGRVPKKQKDNQFQMFYEAVLTQITSNAIRTSLAHKCIEERQVLVFIPYLEAWLTTRVEDMTETPSMKAMCKQRLEAGVDLVVVYPVNNDEHTVIISYEKELIPPRI